MGKLITTTILDAYDWYINCPSSWKEKALKDIVGKLTRTDVFTPTPAIERGMQFEEKVCGLFKGPREDFLAKMSINYGKEGDDIKTYDHTPEIIEFWDDLHDSLLQKKLSRTITIDGIDYYLSGRSDCIVNDVIVDIKTTGDFRSKEQYLKKNQHLLYITCRQKPGFWYKVACFDDEKGICEKVRNVDASLEVSVAEARLVSKIKEFISFLGVGGRDMGLDLLQAYNTQFCKSW